MSNRPLSAFSRALNESRIYLSEVPAPDNVTSKDGDHPVAECLGLGTHEDGGGKVKKVYRFLGFEPDALNFESTVLVSLCCHTRPEPGITSPAGDDVVSAGIAEPNKIPYVILTWGTGITRSTFASRK